MRKLFLYILCACVFASCGNNDTGEKIEINGHECVDLGLPSGLKWATCNVGASLPGQFGDYFRDWCDADAVLSWGKGWRMPTKDEFQELINKCKWEWTAQDYHHGYKVTGPNGKSIFLPAAGRRYYKYKDAAYAEALGFYLTPKEEQCFLSFTSTREYDETTEEPVYRYRNDINISDFDSDSYDYFPDQCEISVRLVAD